MVFGRCYIAKVPSEVLEFENFLQFVNGFSSKENIECFLGKFHPW